MIRDKIGLLLVCCASAAFGAWPTYHGDASLKGVSAEALPENPELLWRHNAGGAVYSTPVSDGERMFFSAKKGRVIAVDLNGSNVWKKAFTLTNDAGQEMPVRFEAPLMCFDGLVFAGSTKGTLYALDAETGAEKWRNETGGILTGSPNVVEPRHVVVLDQSEGALHGIDRANGKLLWKTEGVERCDGSPGIGNGRIVFGSCLAALHVYSFDGKNLKNIEVGGDGQIAGGVAMDGNQAFAGTRDGGMLCVDLDKGEVVWSSDESEDQTFSTPAVSSKRVVYSSDNGFVYAVDRKDGKLCWSFDTGGIPSSPVIAKDKVVVSTDGVLYLLTLEAGAKLWSKEVSDELTSPAIISGMIVVGADDGTVSAWGSPQGVR